MQSIIEYNNQSTTTVSRSNNIGRFLKQGLCALIEQISSTDSFSILSNLKSLNISNNSVQILKGLPKRLEILDVTYNLVKSIEGIHLDELKDLKCAGNPGKFNHLNLFEQFPSLIRMDGKDISGKTLNLSVSSSATNFTKSVRNFEAVKDTNQSESKSDAAAVQVSNILETQVTRMVDAISSYIAQSNPEKETETAKHIAKLVEVVSKSQLLNQPQDVIHAVQVVQSLDKERLDLLEGRVDAVLKTVIADDQRSLGASSKITLVPKNGIQKSTSTSNLSNDGECITIPTKIPHFKVKIVQTVEFIKKILGMGRKGSKCTRQ